MTVTVASNPTGTPPNNVITVTSGVNTVMSQVSLYRNDASGATLVRTQPATGFASQTVTDYECPYGVGTTYSWSATYFSTSGFTTVWDETWANTSAWTSAGTLSWTVASGAVSMAATNVAQRLYRTYTGGQYRFTFSSLAATYTNGGAQPYIFLGFASLSVNATTGVVMVSTTNQSTGYVNTTISAASTFTVDMGATTFTITGTGGTYSQAYYGNVTTTAQITLGIAGAGATAAMTVGQIEMQSYGTTSTISETSAATTLSPSSGWLVHPITPTLSCPLNFSGILPRSSTVRNAGDVTNAANVTMHSILGSATPIATVTGPRADDTWSLVVSVTSAAEEAALKAMLYDQTAILINIPPRFGINIAWGFYQVGDTVRSRLAQIPNSVLKNYTLPLTRTQSPVASIINTGWSWAALLNAEATWGILTQAFNTWADVFNNNRNPGF